MTQKKITEWRNTLASEKGILRCYPKTIMAEGDKKELTTQENKTERLRALDGTFIEKEFDWKRLDAVLALGGEMKEAMGMLDLSEMTITNKIRQRYDMTFAEYRDIRLTHKKYKLRDTMWKAAEAGNVTAMIWLSKNMLGMTDKFSAEVEVNTKTITFNYNIPGNRYLQKKPDVVIDQGGSSGAKIED